MRNPITVPGAPKIPGLTFRRFRGEADYPHMAALIAACKVADNVERSTTVEDIARTYRYLENCDPATDMLFAEIDGQLIAYGRIFWHDLAEGIRLYHIIGFLHPDWRHKGLATAMWKFAERRGREIAAEHPPGRPKYFQCEPFDSEKDMVALLEKQGYEPVRYEIYMTRDLSKPFPETPLPEGLEVRPVVAADLWPIYHATNEAFRDHWGIRDMSEEEYREWMEAPTFQPALWKVAWDGDQMASVVHNFVDEKENEEYGRKRGYTEGIATRRPWRKRGLARALLIQSMRMFKEMGMTETALSTDAQNLSGSLRLYEGVGYKKVKQQTIYRKRLE
ncbi:MAG: GNAT family N-acetyltransferase [Anaerolineales bacterium]|nr:GNAT family N-acetyltransferase [Anaerolineales bacterium]